MANLGSKFTKVSLSYGLSSLLSGDKVDYEFLYTNELDNGVLASLNARYKKLDDRSTYLHYDDIRLEPTLDYKVLQEFTNDDLSILYKNICNYVTDDESPNKFAYYTLAGSAIIYIIDVVNDGTNVDEDGNVRSFSFARFYTESGDYYDYEFADDNILVNYLLLLIQSSQELTNFSPYLHDLLDNPHAEFGNYVNITKNIVDLFSKNLINQDLVLSQSNTKLGENLENYESGILNDFDATGVEVYGNIVERNVQRVTITDELGTNNNLASLGMKSDLIGYDPNGVFYTTPKGGTPIEITKFNFVFNNYCNGKTYCTRLS